LLLDVEKAFDSVWHEALLKRTMTYPSALLTTTPFRSSSVRFIIDDVELERVTEIKYLGVIIDDKLKFDSNVEYIIKKAAKKVHLIGRLSNKLTTNSKIMLFKSIVAPYFDYCSSILFLANEAQFQEMQRVQNQMMRKILRCSREARIIDMLLTLYWMTIKQRVCNKTLVMIFKIDKGELPEYLSINLFRVRDSHTRTTTSGNDFVLPRRQAIRSPNHHQAE
jgi:hypothetical protein